ncbi:hypothetical protein HMPREF0621_1589 [Pasteurella dagmatis ATCC 43325]|uniref:Uncharacterized protein n=1 Tax=Pasteurella dagmatis ATCC 43325 TaxID=667128 RepID=C9PRG5_9PAST|nr:hypothetical protein HMPREF0621_1589 [Pasteurella dagmatis ATCC 43325]
MKAQKQNVNLIVVIKKMAKTVKAKMRRKVVHYSRHLQNQHKRLTVML